MKQHEERALTEKAEIDTKREYLMTFLEGEVFETLQPEDQNLLKLQVSVMKTYSDILAIRIGKFDL